MAGKNTEEAKAKTDEKTEPKTDEKITPPAAETAAELPELMSETGQAALKLYRDKGHKKIAVAAAFLVALDDRNLTFDEKPTYLKFFKEPDHKAIFYLYFSRKIQVEAKIKKGEISDLDDLIIRDVGNIFFVIESEEDAAILANALADHFEIPLLDGKEEEEAKEATEGEDKAKEATEGEGEPEEATKDKDEPEEATDEGKTEEATKDEDGKDEDEDDESPSAMVVIGQNLVSALKEKKLAKKDFSDGKKLRVYLKEQGVPIPAGLNIVRLAKSLLAKLEERKAK